MTTSVIKICYNQRNVNVDGVTKTNKILLCRQALYAQITRHIQAN